MPEMMTAPVPGAMPPDVPPAASTADADPSQAMGTGGEQATPEEQEQYDKIVANAMTLVYSEQAMPSVVEMLKGDGDSIQGLAVTASQVINYVTNSAEKAGVELNAVVAFHAGTEIFEDLADLSKEADIMDFSQDPDALEKAYFLALDMTRKMLQDSGRLNPDDADADMQQLNELDQNGELEQILMRLAERDAGGSTMAPRDQGMQPRGLMTGEM